VNLTFLVVIVNCKGRLSQIVYPRKKKEKPIP
jgi:hypothetical protein